MSDRRSVSPRQLAYTLFADLSDEELRLEFARVMDAFQDECERRDRLFIT
jgi:hypothetical protein